MHRFFFETLHCIVSGFFLYVGHLTMRMAAPVNTIVLFALGCESQVKWLGRTQHGALDALLPHSLFECCCGYFKAVVSVAWLSVYSVLFVSWCRCARLLGRGRVGPIWTRVQALKRWQRGFCAAGLGFE